MHSSMSSSGFFFHMEIASYVHILVIVFGVGLCGVNQARDFPALSSEPASKFPGDVGGCVWASQCASSLAKLHPIVCPSHTQCWIDPTYLPSVTCFFPFCELVSSKIVTYSLWLIKIETLEDRGISVKVKKKYVITYSCWKHCMDCPTGFGVGFLPLAKGVFITFLNEVRKNTLVIIQNITIGEVLLLFLHLISECLYCGLKRHGLSVDHVVLFLFGSLLAV